MSIYLNTIRPLENFKELYNENFFVDKSKIISLLNERISTKGKYICITRPRRVGKSSVADMLGAYYSKAYNSKEIFDNLNISNCKSYLENLNKYNVITISFNDIPEYARTYSDYIKNSLACVVTLAYLSARDKYRVEREEKTGKGFADFTFHPRRKNDAAFVLELKKDVSVAKAIRQIKEKEYFQKFRQEHEENLLAVAICYDSNTKEHSCKIERINFTPGVM